MRRSIEIHPEPVPGIASLLDALPLSRPKMSPIHAAHQKIRGPTGLKGRLTPPSESIDAVFIAIDNLRALPVTSLGNVKKTIRVQYVILRQESDVFCVSEAKGNIERT